MLAESFLCLLCQMWAGSKLCMGSVWKLVRMWWLHQNTGSQKQVDIQLIKLKLHTYKPFLFPFLASLRLEHALYRFSLSLVGALAQERPCKDKLACQLKAVRWKKDVELGFAAHLVKTKHLYSKECTQMSYTKYHHIISNESEVSPKQLFWS